MNIKNFEVGQIVWIELVGNASRGKTAEQCIQKWEITSIGRKYIKAGRRIDNEIWGETTFEFHDYYEKFVEKTNCCVDYILYETRQEIEGNHEKSKLFDEIRNRFSYGSQGDITLEQLRLIHDILERKQEV